MSVEIIRRGEYFSRGGMISREAVFSGINGIRMILSVPEGSNYFNVLAIQLDEDLDIYGVVDALGRSLVRAEKLSKEKVDLAFIRTPKAEYEFSKEDIDVIRKVYSRTMPPGVEKLSRSITVKGKVGPVCTDCMFNPENFFLRVTEHSHYVVDLLKLLEFNPTEVPEEPFDVCFNCLLETKGTIIGSGLRAIGKSPKPVVRAVVKRQSFLDVEEEEVVESFYAYFTYVKLVRTPEGLMLKVDPMTPEEESFLQSMRIRLRDYLASSGITLDPQDRARNYSLLTKLFNDILATPPPLDVAKVRERLLAEVTGLGKIQPLVEVAKELGIVDIKVQANSRATVSTLSYGTLTTNVILSPEEIEKSAKMLAYKRPESKEIRGVLEAAAPVELMSGDRIVVRVQYRRPPSSMREEATFRFLSPTGLFHFAFPPPYGYGNATPEVMANLALLFGRTNFLVAGEPGSAKSSLNHALIYTLPPRSNLVYIAESFELDVDSLSDMVVTTYTLDSGLDAAMRRSLREQADFVLVEEARSKEELNVYVRDIATVRKMAVTFHAAKADLLEVRGSDLVKFFDTIVVMSPVSEIGGRPRYVVRDVLVRGERVCGWDGSFFHADPEELVEKASLRDFGFNEEEARKFHDSVVSYLMALWDMRDELVRLGVRWNARAMDREAFRLIYRRDDPIKVISKLDDFILKY